MGGVGRRVFENVWGATRALRKFCPPSRARPSHLTTPSSQKLGISPHRHRPRLPPPSALSSSKTNGLASRLRSSCSLCCSCAVCTVCMVDQRAPCPRICFAERAYGASPHAKVRLSVYRPTNMFYSR